MKLPGREWSISEQNPRTTAAETALCTTFFLPESFRLCCGLKISHVVSSTVDMVQTVRKTSHTGGGQRQRQAPEQVGPWAAVPFGGCILFLGWEWHKEKSYIACHLTLLFPNVEMLRTSFPSSFQIHETIETINQLKTQREFMLSFARDPQGFINDWLQSQCRDLKVGNRGQVQRDLGPRGTCLLCVCSVWWRAGERRGARLPSACSSREMEMKPSSVYLVFTVCCHCAHVVGDTDCKTRPLLSK